MLRHHSKLVAGIVLLSFSIVNLFGQAAAPQESPFADTAEYDLYTAMAAENDNAKKLVLLDSWKQKYPNSKLKPNRLGLYIGVYQALGKGEEMYQAAKELLGLLPEEPSALMYVTILTKSLMKKAPADLDYGEKVANQFIGILDKTFAANKAQRDTMEVTARQTLIYIHDARGNKPKAEEEYKKALGVTPHQGALSFEYGQYIIRQQDTSRYSEAIWHVVRGATMEGTGGIPAANKAAVTASANRIYTTVHGSLEGMPALVEQVKASALPPAGFKILSAGEVQAQKAEELAKSNPNLATWKTIKDGLLESPDYWNTLNGSAMPKLTAKVVSTSPAARPKEVMVAISNDTETEIKLVFETPFATAAPVGTELTFEGGVAKDFAKTPFLLTIEQDKKSLTGWPTPARGPVKAAPAKAGKGKAK